MKKNIIFIGMALAIWIIVQTFSNMVDAEHSEVKSDNNNIEKSDNRNNRNYKKTSSNSVELSINHMVHKASGELKSFGKMLDLATESDFPGLFEKINTFQGEEKQLAIHLLAAKWASINSLGAVSFSREIVDHELAKFFLFSVLSSWPKEELSKGFEWIAGISDSTEREEALNALLSCAVRLDPIMASGYVVMLEDGNMKTLLVSQLAHVWADSDPESALNWARRSLTGKCKLEALYAIGSDQSKSNPTKAVAILNEIPFGNYRDNLISDIASNWIVMDLKSAIGWITTLDQSDQNAAALAISSGWGRLDPEQAISYGEKLPSGPKEQFIENVLTEWGRKDPHAAVAWVKTSSVSMSGPVLQGMFESWSMLNPQDAADHVNDFVEEGIKSVLITSIARNWAQKNPTEAAKFATSLPEGSAKIEAVGNVVNHWARDDSMAASEWVSSMDHGAVRDRGILALAGAILKGDPKSAFEWTLELDNPIEREKWINKVGQEWIRNQGESAASQIKAMGLSPKTIQSLGLR